MDSNDTPATPEPGTDSRVEDWHGQSVERDAQLADELSETLPPDEAERAFDERSTGRAEQAARHGDAIDPEQGESAYKGTDAAMDDDERKVAKVPLTLGAVMGAFLVVAALVAILIWAI